MMSYVIRTASRQVIVIDGGNAGDGPYLADFLAGLGNRAAAWFITHPHSDHTHALLEILRAPSELAIGAIYASTPDPAWMAAYTTALEQADYAAFYVGLAAAGQQTTELELGQELLLDGVRVEVLGIWNPELTANPINNQSLILRVSDHAKSVLFTGDLGEEAGEKALAGPYADRLRADYVQMAHHGQNGVSQAFYRHVGATRCLWPTPDWLWENDSGGGRGSGPWQTLEVRDWMRKLPIERHYLGFEGLQRVD
jgi:beta-lactamase superfamily II metal-dependent hydrolase